MTAFEHVTALFSFVYALALTHLLARIAELIVERDRVKFSGERTRPACNASPARTFGALAETILHLQAGKFAMTRASSPARDGACAPPIV